jgi:ATP-dependent DNA helicase DinG
VLTVLPEWVETIRPNQVFAIQEILNAFSGGAQIVMLDAPTGSGKTLIGEMVRQNLGVRGLYLCSSISLQTQFCKDFPAAALLKGRSNYPTGDSPNSFPEINAGDCQKSRGGVCSTCMDDDPPPEEDALHCPWCHPVTSCHYETAKYEAMCSDLVCSNTSYFLHEANYVGNLPLTRKLVVIDEADTLEDVLMGFVSVSITPQRAKQFGIEPPDRKTVLASWVQWAIEAQERLKGVTVNGDSVQSIRDRSYLSRLRQNLSRLNSRDSGLSSGGWVYTGYQEGHIEFKPVSVSSVAKDFLWKHCPRFLLMSATTISYEQVASDLGFDGRLNWSSVTVPSSFPPSRRPVYIHPIAEMTKKQKESSWPKLADALRTVIDRHPEDRILVHTVSYDLNKYLLDTLSRSTSRLISYSRTQEKQRAIDRYIYTPAAVLLAPSLDRGIDLPDNDCRVIVVCKIPFPFLGDKQVSARLHSPGGSLWYSVKTVRSLVQMTGRGFRHEEDYCESYILDASFMSNIWRRSRNLLPSWWREAIDMQHTWIT